MDSGGNRACGIPPHEALADLSIVRRLGEAVSLNCSGDEIHGLSPDRLEYLYNQLVLKSKMDNAWVF
jgi:hypothetical protein